MFEDPKNNNKLVQKIILKKQIKEIFTLLFDTITELLQDLLPKFY